MYGKLPETSVSTIIERLYTGLDSRGVTLYSPNTDSAGGGDGHRSVRTDPWNSVTLRKSSQDRKDGARYSESGGESTAEVMDNVAGRLSGRGIRMY